MNSIIHKTLEDIASKKFEIVRKGYDTAMVDQFLEDVRQYLQGVETERDALRAEVGSLRAEVDRLKKMEQTVANALLTAQKTADELRSQAQTEHDSLLEESRKEAEEIVQQARKQAEEILQEARADVRQLELVTQTLQRRREDLIHELSGLLHRHLDLLEEDKAAEVDMEKTHIFRTEDLGVADDHTTLPMNAPPPDPASS